MARTIEQALSEEATKRLFTYDEYEPEPDAPLGTNMTRAEWEQLSPGYRRAITREFAPKVEPPEVAPTLQERKEEIEYAGRKRL